MKSTGHVRYDVEKLRWLNHKWIERMAADELAQRCLPYVEKSYPQIQQLSPESFSRTVQMLKSELHTLIDAPAVLSFLFIEPSVDPKELHHLIPQDQLPRIAQLIETNLSGIKDPATWVNILKQEAKNAGIALNHLFWFIRLALIGKTNGPSLHDLIDILGIKKSIERIKKVTSLFSF